jgi:hypothetical protein
MKRHAFLTLAALTLCAAPLAAQGGPPMPAGGAEGGMHHGPSGPGMAGMHGPGMPGMAAMHMGAHAAEFLLAHTAQLKLTDAQVTRLAAIARRTRERMETMHNSMQGMHAAPAPGTQPQPPSAADMQRMRQMHEQMATQTHADLRDALSVLTPDQQASAWEAAAEMIHGGGPGHGGPGMRGPGMQHGPGMQGHGEHGAPPAPPHPQS